MATIILNDGRRVDHPDLLQAVPPATVTHLVDVNNLAAKLEAIRHEWEQSAPNLELVAVPLHLALADMAGLIGLTPDETRRALGARLYSLIEDETK